MRRIIFGLNPTAVGPDSEALRRELGTLLTEALDIEVYTRIAESYSMLLDDLAQGHVHVAWVPPAVFLRAHDEHGARLLVAAQRKSFQTRYHGVLFVQNDDDRREMEQFRGCTVAWVDPDSAGGFMFPRLAMMEKGLDPRTFFGKEEFQGTHVAVVDAVASGAAELGATYMNLGANPEDTNSATIGAGWIDAGLGVSMRPVLTSQPIPNDVVCVTRELDEDIYESFGDALRRIHKSPSGLDTIKRLLKVRRFESTDLREYDIVRAAMNIDLAG